jgi:hypothetical protein
MDEHNQDATRARLLALPNEQLVGMLEDAARNWLAHDGLWFLAVERHFGLDAAIALDAEAWGGFAEVEAMRVMRRHDIAPRGGLDALAAALPHRMYALLNPHALERRDDRTLVFEMRTCRVQTARERKGLPPFPCQPVGEVEFTTFARTIDARIHTRCLGCPPASAGKGFACAWEFRMESD